MYDFATSAEEYVNLLNLGNFVGDVTSFSNVGVCIGICIPYFSNIELNAALLLAKEFESNAIP